MIVMIVNIFKTFIIYDVIIIYTFFDGFFIFTITLNYFDYEKITEILNSNLNLKLSFFGVLFTQEGFILTY